jgi:hypothetical protein
VVRSGGRLLFHSAHPDLSRNLKLGALAKNARRSLNGARDKHINQDSTAYPVS